MDFEEVLEAHSIRKSSNGNINGDDPQQAKSLPRRDQNTQKPKVFDYIPLTLRLLSTLSSDNWIENYVISAYKGLIHFKNCLVYGMVFGRREKGKCYTYMLDDGTALMEMRVSRNTRELDTVLKLENELNLTNREAVAQNKHEIIKSLKNLLLMTKKQLWSTSNIKDGSRVLVYCRPTYFMDKVSLDALHILQDNSEDRSFELAYKDELVDWHKKNILLS